MPALHRMLGTLAPSHRPTFPRGHSTHGRRRCRVILPLALLLCLLGFFVAPGPAGELGRRRKAVDPQNMNAAAGYPNARADAWPLPGPRPYWGQALGATHYNWGYFGARHDRSQFIGHSGFYGEYTQFGYSRGY